MFTGIIDHCEEILSVVGHADSMSVTLRTKFSDLVLGESIAVDGICLTVADIMGDSFRCDLSAETLSKTTAKQFSEGRVLNLERALQINDRLGGHIVTGHVDCVAELVEKNAVNDCYAYHFSGFTHDQMLYFVAKGCVSVNGVSLTVNEVIRNGFTVMLIPHTLSHSNLSALNEGSAVNIEFDYLARYVVQRIAAQPQ